jgi:nitrate reductase NapE component
MTSATPIHPAAPDNEGRPESFAQRRPVTAFLLLAFGIGWPVLGIPLIMGLQATPFLLLLVFLAVLRSALVVTLWRTGRAQSDGCSPERPPGRASRSRD